MRVEALRWIFRGEIHTAIEIGTYTLRLSGRSVEIIDASNVITFLPLNCCTQVSLVGLLTKDQLQTDYALVPVAGYSLSSEHVLFHVNDELKTFASHLRQLVEFDSAVKH